MLRILKKIGTYLYNLKSVSYIKHLRYLGQYTIVQDSTFKNPKYRITEILIFTANTIFIH